MAEITLKADVVIVERYKVIIDTDAAIILEGLPRRVARQLKYIPTAKLITGVASGQQEIRRHEVR